MITINSAENALKTVYLGTITDLLNTKVNPLLTKIEQTSIDVTGKEIRRSIRTSLDGGVGAGDESGELPQAYASNFLQYIITLKNLYGQIEISDKSMRAGSDTKGAFTNLLNESLEGLLQASRFNLSRMLYGDGTGSLGLLSQGTNDVGILSMATGANRLSEGMCIDIYAPSDPSGPMYTGVRILAIDRSSATPLITTSLTEKVNGICEAFVQGSRGKEITGLGAIFNTSKSLYGLDRTQHRILKPFLDDSNQKISDIVLSAAIDNVETFTSSKIDYITCSQDVKLAYQAYLNTFKRNVDIMELAGGFKTLSFNGIPVVAERFMNNGEMYMLDSSAFKMHQLCDWQFIENENGKVLRQTQGKPTYSATLVKYCDLVCERPNGQAKLKIDTKSA